CSSSCPLEDLHSFPTRRSSDLNNGCYRNERAPPFIFSKTEWSEMPMVKDLSRDDERRGTRRIMLAGSAVAAALFVGLLGWFATQIGRGTRLNSSHSQISYAVFC